jgi:hypothetical protein
LSYLGFEGYLVLNEAGIVSVGNSVVYVLAYDQVSLFLSITLEVGGSEYNLIVVLDLVTFEVEVIVSLE